MIADGRLALLDNLIKKQVIFVDQAGRVEKVIPLIRAEISQPEAISGIYCRLEGAWPGLWAELENRFILLAGLDGQVPTRIISLPGLLGPSGRRLFKIEVADVKKLLLFYSDEEFKVWHSSVIEFKLPLGIIYGPWEDKKGNIYVATNIFDEKKEANEVVLLTSDGRERGWLKIALSSGRHEILKPIQVTRDGYIYQLVIEANEDYVVIR